MNIIFKEIIIIDKLSHKAKIQCFTSGINIITSDMQEGNYVGKSTLLKLMTKIIYPTSGSVETNGKLTSLLELGAGFHPDFTGRENIYFNAGDVVELK